MKWYWVLAMLLYASITFFFYAACVVAARYDAASANDYKRSKKEVIRHDE